MAIPIDELVVLTRSTLKNMDRGKLTNLMTNTRRHEAWNRLIRRKSFQLDGGESIKHNALFQDNGAAKWTALYDEDTTGHAEGLENVETPWRHMVTSWSIDRREPALNNGDPRLKIIDIMKIKRAQGWQSNVNLFEPAFWSKPVSSSDKLTMWGIMNWIVDSDVDALTDQAAGDDGNNGFNGGNAAGFPAGPGGLDSSLPQYAAWRNYTDVYTNISRDDLFRRMRTCHEMINFETPQDIEDFRSAAGRGSQYMIYTTYPVVREIEELLEDRNDDLGHDIAVFDGAATFKKHKIISVPQLEKSDLLNPIYFINWDVLRIYFKSGFVLNESKPDRDPNRHNVVTSFVDTMLNISCCDRRSLAVLKQAA
jgi:hypothetical protein